MLFGKSQQPQPAKPGREGADTSASPNIFDVTARDFEDRVLRASLERPVIVDFWAPWCGPCKQLGPQLEAAVEATNGQVVMAKVNLDDNPELAQALRIQSVPTVYAFVQGQPVDAFMGAQPESKVKEFIANLVKVARQMQPESIDIPAALKEAAEALAEGDLARAQGLYAQILGEDESNAQAFTGIVRTYIAAGQVPQARAILDQAPEAVRKSPVFSEAETALELAEAGPSGTPAEFEAKLAKDPGNQALRFELAMALFAHGRKEEAADALLDILRADRAWEEEKARTQLLKFFEAWGPADPATLKARRKLSGILFS
ncbi:MAG: thioredoxin [Alphaproteobacteria bacterium]|nr:thioredoxin [Alphaproteobacteria bacterium]